MEGCYTDALKRPIANKAANWTTISFNGSLLIFLIKWSIYSMSYEICTHRCPLCCHVYNITSIGFMWYISPISFGFVSLAMGQSYDEVLWYTKTVSYAMDISNGFTRYTYDNTNLISPISYVVIFRNGGYLLKTCLCFERILYIN